MEANLKGESLLAGKLKTQLVCSGQVLQNQKGDSRAAALTPVESLQILPG